jgi:uncharacterized membrane protein YdjX (TVP38/TMEM64 family)
MMPPFAKIFERTDVISLVVMIVVLVALGIFVDVDTIKGWVFDAGAWAPVVFVITKVLTIVIAPISGSPLYPLAGLLFGFWPGIIFISLGDFLGYSISFYISRRFGRPVVLRLLSDKEEGVLPKIIEYAGTTRGMLHLCFTFFSMTDVIAYGAGLGPIRYAKFILILWPFSLVGSSILVVLGATVGIEGGSLALLALVPLFSLTAGGLGFFFFVRRVKGGQGDALPRMTD